MKYITLQQIKQQLRLDDEQAMEEHGLLEMYGESAEEAVLNIVRRSLVDVIVSYNGLPKPIVNATLMLVSQWYTHRQPATAGTLAPVPYAFDLMLKPYMRLAGQEATPDWEDQLPQGAVVSSDGRVMLDSQYRMVCAKTA